jgi:hypothetical protein
VFGSKKYKEKLDKQLENFELSFGGFKVKRKECDKYLGQILHTLAKSVETTITDREGKVK